MPDYDWNSPNIGSAIGISVGAGLATAVGGALAFCPSVLKSVPPNKILAVALALSAGVMLYVSFIEIFVKSYESIVDSGQTTGAASAITTTCFFGGMFITVLLEMFVDWLLKRYGGASEEGHSHGLPRTACACDPKAEVPTPDQSAASLDGEGEGDTEGDAEAPGASAAKQADPAASGVVVDVGGTGGVVNIVDGGGGAASSAELQKMLESESEKKKLARMGMLTALAIGIHNFPEGLATFLATLEDEKVGASLGVAIAVHNVPEGLCVAMPVLYATGNKWKAFGWSLLSGLTEPIGGLVGFAILQPVFTDLVFGIVFSMVGGMMVFIVLHELLPAAHRYMGSQWKATAWLVLGMFIMALSLVLFKL